MQLTITRSDVVVPVRADPAGITGPTPGRARGPRWRASSPGMFTPADVEADGTEQRIVEAVAGGVEGCAATGWAGLHWQGSRWFSGRHADGTPVPVLLAVGDHNNLAPREGVRFCHDWLFADDAVDVDGLPVTRAERSVCAEVLRVRTLAAAVRIIEMAAADDLVDVGSLRDYAARIKGRPHTIRLNQAIELADENIWSPGESDLKWAWSSQRPAAPLLCNRPVFDRRGRHLLTPDLLDPVAGVVGEYDGRFHEQQEVRRRDLDRVELYRDLELEVVVMMSTDLRDLRSFHRRLAAAYRRAAARTPSSTRAWTLEQPSWWVDTSTVERRRALTEHERRIWLRRLAL